jgi:hypothetical protein
LTLSRTDYTDSGYLGLPFLEPVLFPFVKQVRLCAAHVGYLGTPVPVFFGLRAFLAVVRIRHAYASANHTTALVRSVVTLIAHSNKRRRAHERIAVHTPPVAPLAQPTDRDAGQLAAHDQIGVVLRHCGEGMSEGNTSFRV